MKAKLAGFVLCAGLSLAAQADTFHFTPMINPNNPGDLGLLLDLGNQLTMDVTEGSSNNAVFTFTNDAGGGDIDSVITKIYFADAQSDLFSNVAIAGSGGGDVDFNPVSPTPLPGGTTPLAFDTTDELDAAHPHPFMGINNTTASPGEFLTLSAALNPGRTFADVISSLNAGSETNPGFLRVGLRVTSIDQFDDNRMSYIDRGAAGSGLPPPIPEPATYGMLLAGLGLVSAIARRRQKND